MTTDPNDTRPTAHRLTVTPETMRRAEALGFEPGEDDVLLWALNGMDRWREEWQRADALALALAERATQLEAERDAARTRADNFNELIGRCWGALQVEPVGGIVDAIAALRAERDATAAHVAICPGCGEVETCDEDRCCSCGRDLLVFADRYSAELYQEGQQERSDDIATLRMRVAEVNEVLCSNASDKALRVAVAGLCSFARQEGP